MNEETLISQYLSKYNYASVRDWARDSDYTQQEDDTWNDESGNEVDIDACLFYAIEAASDGDLILDIARLGYLLVRHDPNMETK